MEGDWRTWIGNLYASQSIHTQPPSTLVERYWLNIVERYGDFYLLFVFYIFMNLCYAFGGLIFWFVDRYKLLENYKIQEKYPNNEQYLDCIKNLLTNYVLIIVPIIVVSYPIFGFLGFSTALPLPSAGRVIAELFFCMIVEDVTHYWLHRLLHHPLLYKAIHKQHHFFATPFGLAASYAHPAEVLILGFATFFGPLLLRPHFFSFYIWVLYRQVDAVSTHCGYDLPHPFNILPYYGGTKPHDYHHKNFIWNYSSRFTFMDKLFGTYKECC